MFKQSIVFICVCFVGLINAQNGILKGILTDNQTNEPLIGALIVVQGKEIAAESDLDGNYSLSIPAGKHNIIFSYDTYDNDTLKDFVVTPGQIVYKNIAMKPVVNDIGAVTFVQKVEKNNEMGNLIEKKKEANTSDNVDAKTLSKGAASNVSDGLKKVTGASIQDGKFAIIRGMSDRYNAGYINGSPLPSTEADKKAFSFDILPTSLVDNLVILKSGSPDLTGDFGGGIIKVSTKSIPDSFSVNIGMGGQYNSVTTNKSYTAFNGSKTDWLGYDNNLREHPTLTTGLPNNSPNDNIELASRVNDSKKFNNDFNTQQFRVPFGSRFNFSIGTPFVKKENFQIGAIAALNYNLTYTRTELQNNLFLLEDGGPQSQAYSDTVGVMNVNNSGLVNVASKIYKNHKIEYKGLNSISSTITNLSRFGYDDLQGAPYNTINQYGSIMLYNRLRTHQFLGEHNLINNKLKIDWNLSFTKIIKLIPDYRVVNYNNIFSEDDGVYNTVISRNPDFKKGNGRFFGDLSENLSAQSLNIKYDFSKPDSADVSFSIKVGGFRQVRVRDFNSQKYIFINVGQANLNPTKPGQDFNNTNFENNNTYFRNVNGVTDQGYVANSNLYATYVMAENSIVNKVKISYGFRYEIFKQQVGPTENTKTTLKMNSILPSLNVNYKLTSLKSNLRIAAYKTLNRPEFREVASFAFYDFLQNADVVGNPNLKIADLNNYEIRYEFLPTPEQIVSIGGFYKVINNPIELRYDVTQPTFRTFNYANENQARVYGLELDFKKNFSFIGKESEKNFFNFMYFTSNIAIMQSRVTINDESTSSNDRPLQGQSPYLLNLALGYDNKENGWSVTLSGNKYGRRLASVGPTRDPIQKLNTPAGYDMFENPRTVIDFQVAKTIKRFTIKGTLGDILRQDLIFYNDRNGDKKFDKNSDNTIFRSKLGYTFTLALSAKF